MPGLHRPLGTYYLKHVLTHMDVENILTEFKSKSRRLPRLYNNVVRRET